MTEQEEAKYLDEVAREMKSLSHPLQINIQPEILFCLIGQVQLALKHPKNVSLAADIARAFCVSYEEWFAKKNCPTTAKVIAMGWSEEVS